MFELWVLVVVVWSFELVHGKGRRVRWTLRRGGGGLEGKGGRGIARADVWLVRQAVQAGRPGAIDRSEETKLD